MRSISLVPIVALAIFRSAAAAEPYYPTAAEISQSYEAMRQFGAGAARRCLNLQLDPMWGADGHSFVYRCETGTGTWVFKLVRPDKVSSSQAFDHERFAAALSLLQETKVSPDKLTLNGVKFAKDLKSFTFKYRDTALQCTLKDYSIVPVAVPAASILQPPTPPEFKLRIKDEHLQIQKSGSEEWVSQPGLDSVGGFQMLPDQEHAFAYRLIPGDRKSVMVIQSSPKSGTRGVPSSQLYDQPGDKLDTYEVFWIDLKSGEMKNTGIAPIMTDGQPYSQPPQAYRWDSGREMLFTFPIRGYQEAKVVSVNCQTGESRELIDEKEKTFVDASHLIFEPLEKSKEIIWRSERDGWGHFYRIGNDGHSVSQITKGNWVVRGIEKINEDQKFIIFRGNGLDLIDPYFIHFYRVNFDGTGLKDLTPAGGNHAIEFSPDGSVFHDAYSQVDTAPVHELRSSADGKLILTLEKADVSKLGIPEISHMHPFKSKGRDGKTDIYGIWCGPANLDPNKKYPVIENIYAGPHDSFVPKSFIPASGMARLAQLGFIVVQIDGMGTSNRGKAFHDVCYKNLSDAGFPDRIAWIKALASENSFVDDSRVGIYGTSAGGQNAAAAVLFYPEFYGCAVAACGCHDNRMDKVWWNEQWMGYPVDESYAKNSNIDNASKLTGQLMLIVGEMDKNVPPESTYRFADALIKAGKDFDLVVIPGSDHTDGGPFGDHKRMDFFVRNLLGAAPPKWKTQSK